MRTIRGSAIALALVALSPALAMAQSDRPFTDAWFWGAKVGALAYSTTRVENAFAPSVGADWVITRNRGALYVSLDRAFFSEESSIADASTVTGESVVDVRDLTRLGFALLAFPKQFDNMRPYGGVGLALNFIQRAVPSGGSGNGFTESVIEEQRSRASFQLMLGAQWELRSMSLFGQVVMLPFESGFLLNGRSAYSLEGGIRWNVGSAIDKIK